MAKSDIFIIFLTKLYFLPGNGMAGPGAERRHFRED
jgi:hypothetical protein